MFSDAHRQRSRDFRVFTKLHDLVSDRVQFEAPNPLRQRPLPCIAHPALGTAWEPNKHFRVYVYE